MHHALTELSNSLWTEAVNAATFLRNRCPTKTLENKTPYKAWSGEKPYVGFLRVIGSKAIALNKNGRNKKFDSKGLEYVLVGYSQESKAYRLWRRGTKTVIKVRDVRFFEEIDKENTIGDVFLDQRNDNKADEGEDTNEDDVDDQNEQRNQQENKGQDLNENTVKRGPSRPKIIRTPGRPKRIYTIRRTMSDGNVEREDPTTVDEALKYDEANL